jgi:pimeloyl-ACP methyl ester carboxylesterase
VGALVAMAPATGVPAERREATLARITRMEKEGPRAVADEGFAASWPDAVRHDMEAFRKFRARWLGNDPNSYGMIHRMLLDADIEGGFARIACPTLVLAGQHDRARPPESVEPLARMIPGAQYRVVNSGHFMAVQTPALIGALVNEFLKPLGY